LLKAITIGAGVLWNDAYNAVNQHGRVLVGGLSAQGTVGAAGGWLLGGGHSVISPTFGLGSLLSTALSCLLTHISPGVDNVVEINIVTATGDHLTVNSHQHTDLFWALRGGGGGTYGVVTSVTYRTHPSIPITVVSFESKSSNASTMKKIFREFIRIHPALSDQGFAGYGSMINATLSGLFVLVNGSEEATNRSLNPFFEYAQNLTSADGSNPITTQYDSFYSFYQLFASAEDVEGASIEIASRLVPRDSFENDHIRLADTFFNLDGGVSWKYVWLLNCWLGFRSRNTLVL
jgi:FAD/FMN-containing dehydrogenase